MITQSFLFRVLFCFIQNVFLPVAYPILVQLLLSNDHLSIDHDLFRLDPHVHRAAVRKHDIGILSYRDAPDPVLQPQMLCRIQRDRLQCPELIQSLPHQQACAQRQILLRNDR